MGSLSSPSTTKGDQQVESGQRVLEPETQVLTQTGVEPKRSTFIPGPLLVQIDQGELYGVS